MRIKDAAKYDRPREKMERYGTSKLADHELLAAVLGSGVKGVNVVQLSKKILKKVEQVGLDSITLDDLKDIKGLGNVKAQQVLAALEFGRRQFVKTPEVIVTSEKVCELCSDIRTAKKEHFVAFYLDSRSVLIAREVISIGTLNASLVHPREVFEPALRYGAAALIVAHNHPSGDSTPSEEDYEVTTRLQEVGEMIGIPLLKHVVMTKDSHTVATNN